MPALAQIILLAGAMALTMLGAAVAWSAPNATKRIAGVFVAHLGAILALAVLGAPVSVLTGAAALALVYCALGVAIVVRLQEAYGGVEAPDVDAADDESEPAEPAA